MAYTNNNGQARVGVRIVPQVNSSSLWNSIYSVYNADAVGSSSLKTSLYAAYNFDNNLNDAVGSKNGTGYGGINYGSTSGLINTSIGFNGANAYVNLPNNTGQFNFTDDFSISLWVKPYSTAGYPFLITNYLTSGSNNYGYYLYMVDNTYLRFGISNGTNTAQTNVNQLPPSNVWTHIVITRKKSTITKIYYNGVLMTPSSSTNPTLDLSYQPNTTTTLGAAFGDYKYSGWMDSLNFWTKELTQSEITELYNSGNGAQYITNDFYKPTTNDALNTYNGTAQGGLTYGVGKVGNAFQFNGTNAYVQLPNNSLQFTNKFSASMWMYIPSNVSQDQILVGCLRFTGLWKGWGISMYQNTIYFYIGAGSAGKVDITYGDNSLIGSWAHLVAIHENGIGSKLYVNGVLRATVANINPIVYDSSEISSIGCAFVGGGSSPAWFMKNGSKLDALNIYNRVLTSTEVTELYNSGNGKQYPN